jgi:ABC-type nitrate/sulfonate/bicarbonate transport system ATPase subunit
MTTLKIEQVSRTFPARHGNAPTKALEPTELVIGNNDFVTILGPSGCGKSTLLRIVAGLDRPTTGRVTLDGREVTGPGADRGMVFQSYTLFPWLTVRENIAFGLRERGASEAERNKIAEAFIRQVGLSGFENHWPKQLSGGMQQRTAIARALANDPKILLLDEPFGALDQFTREELWSILQELWMLHKPTVLLVTHDLREAGFLAGRICVMSARPGRILDDSRVGFDRPRTVAMTFEPDFVALNQKLRAFIEDARSAPAQGAA